MNIKTLFVFEEARGKLPKITISDKFFKTLIDILAGKRTKFRGDLAKSFGFYFGKLNLEKSDPLVLSLFLLIRKIQILPSPSNIKTLIYSRAVINKLLTRYRSDQAIVLKLLFENCYRITFKQNSREEILFRAKNLALFFEEILLHTHIK